MTTGLLTEGALRIFDPLGLAFYADGKRYFSELLTPREGFSYIHRPNASAKLRTMDVVTNGQGLRWTEFPELTSEKKRVLILGDSIVFGWGVQVEETFAEKLRRSHASMEFLMAGVASWSTRAEFEWLRREGVRYAPDVVVLVTTTNDVLPTTMPENPGSWIGSVLRQSFLVYAALHVRGLARASRDVDSALQEGSPEWNDAELALRGIAELCEGNDIELIVTMYGGLESEVGRAFYEGYGRVLSSYGIELLRFPDAVYQHGNSPIDPHPNAVGHALMAEWLGPTLARGAQQGPTRRGDLPVRVDGPGIPTVASD